MQREDSLDAHAVGNLAHGERSAIAAAIDFDHNALERLDALLFALANLDMDTDAVADAKLGEVAAKPAVFDLLDDAIHGKMPSVEPTNLSEPPRRLNCAGAGRLEDNLRRVSGRGSTGIARGTCAAIVNYPAAFL